MTTMSATATATTSRIRTGLVLGALLGLANVPFLFVPPGTDQDAPPFALLLLNAVLGLVSVACAFLAWRTANRAVLRIDAACVIVNAVTALPIFFVDVGAGLKVFGAVYVLASVVCVLMLFSGSRRTA